MDTSVGQASSMLKALLVCGIVASALRFAADVLAGALSKGYNFVSQSISELSAVGAPTRPLVMSVEFVWGALMIAFGLGVWRMAGTNVALRVAAGLIMGNVITTLIAAVFFPARYSGTVSTNVSTANVIIGATGMVFFLLAIAFGAAALHGWFRVLSIGILVAYAVLTVVGLLTHRGPGPSGEPTLTTGAQERTMMYSYLLWVAALAVALLRSAGESVNRGPV